MKNAALLLTLACSLFAKGPYSAAEIYTQMCANCHGKSAEGNSEKRAPQLNDLSVNELSSELFSIQTDGYQSSGSEHEVMSHNQKIIKEKGMIYHPDDMALYIYLNFNPKSKEAKDNSDKSVYRKFSTEDIFKNMCSKCHGEQAQGNSYKGAPALNNYSLNELEMELITLSTDGFQSSGSHNELMRDTLDKIEKKGMKYHPKDMAGYIYYNFNKEAKK